MTHVWEATLPQLRVEHSIQYDHSAMGWTWCCICGRRGRGGARTQPLASNAAMRHLDSEHQKLVRAARENGGAP